MSAKRVYPRRAWFYLRMITTHARKKEARRNFQVFRNLSPLPSRFADWLQRFCRQQLTSMKKASKAPDFLSSIEPAVNKQAFASDVILYEATTIF